MHACMWCEWHREPPSLGHLNPENSTIEIPMDNDDDDRLWPLPSTSSSSSASCFQHTLRIQKQKQRVGDDRPIFIRCTPHIFSKRKFSTFLLVKKALKGRQQAHFKFNFHQCPRAYVWKVAVQLIFLQREQEKIKDGDLDCLLHWVFWKARDDKNS